MTSRSSLALILACSFLGAAPLASGQTLFVDAALTTGADDGSSWANAFQGPQGLHDALAAAPAGAEIWLASGTYLPSASLDRAARFEIVTDDITVRGGFAGTENSPLERPELGDAPTVLSGDLAGDDDASLANGADNSSLVVLVTAKRIALDRIDLTGGGAGLVPGSVGPGAALWSNGNARGLTLIGCCVERCYGFGVIGLGLDSEHFVEGCSFRDIGQTALELLSFRTLVSVRRCTFERCGTGLSIGDDWENGSTVQDSVARNCGRGIVFFVYPFSVTTARVIGCTVVDNEEPGILHFGGSGFTATMGVVVRNSILVGNDPLGSPPAQVSSFVFPNDSIVEGGFPFSNVIDADPVFVDRAGGDLRLLPGSPAIDRGTDLVYEDGDVDLDGRHRAVDVASVPNEGAGTPDFIDLGAYEFTGSIGDNLGCSAQPNSTGLRGRLLARGSVTAAANDLTIVGEFLPAGQFSMFLTSRQQGLVPMAGGPGTLCLGGAIGRFNRPGEIQAIGAAGTVGLPIDLTNVPQPSSVVAAQPGETWRFQLWHRDLDPGGATTNGFTGVVAVTLE